MHLFVIARGINTELKKWKHDLLAQWLPYPVKVKDGKKLKSKEVQIQLAVRPVQLFDIVFPEECYDEVLRMVRPWEQNKFAGMLRKLMKIKPIKKRSPEWKETFYKVYAPNVGVIGIGVKKDKHDKHGIEML